MPNYQNGKIYKIECFTTNKVYIGSTVLSLHKRLLTHKCNNTVCSSRQVLKSSNYKMSLIELYPCNSKAELLWRERHHMERTTCVNINLPICTVEETRLRKQNYQKNKYVKKRKNSTTNVHESKRNWYHRQDKEKFKAYRIFRKSFGGDPRYENNLLRIHHSIFE